MRTTPRTFVRFAIIMAFGLVLNACNDDEEILPGPVVSGDNVTVSADALIAGNGRVDPSIALGISAENGLSQIEIFEPDGSTFNIYPFPANPASTQQNYILNPVAYADAGLSFDYLLTATDAKGLSGSTTITIAVEDVEATLSLLDDGGNAYLGDSLFANEDLPFDEIEIISNYPIDSVSFIFFGHDGVPIVDPASDYSPDYITPATDPEYFSANATTYTDDVDSEGEPTLPGSISKVLIRVTSITGVFFEQELRVVGTATDELSEVTLGSFDNNTDGSFFSLDDTTALDISDVNADSERADFAYSWGAATNANIFALNDPIAANFFGNNTANWTIIKATKFVKPSDTGIYDQVVVEEDIEAAYEEIVDTEVSRLTGLQVDDVFLIKSDNGDYYAVKVTALTTGADGSIKFTVKGDFTD